MKTKHFLTIILSLVLSNSIYAQESLVTASADIATTALTNEHVTLTSSHSTFIFNNNISVQGFNYLFMYCADLQPCTTKQFVLYLQPHQSLATNWYLVLDIAYQNPGRYVTSATTVVTGPGLNISATGNSTILVNHI